MPLFDDQLVQSPCEIKTLGNDLLTTAVIKSTGDDVLELINPNDTLPIIHCDTLVKINIFHRTLGFKVFVGRVFLSTAEFMRIIEIQSLADFEKRNFFRIKVNLSAKAYIIEDDLPPDGALKLFPIHIEDLSLSGCFIRTRKPMATGQRIIINLTLPDEVNVTLCALIQREQNLNNSNGYGCSFLDISARQSDILCNFIFQKQREQIRSMRDIQASYRKD